MEEGGTKGRWERNDEGTVVTQSGGDSKDIERLSVEYLSVCVCLSPPSSFLPLPSWGILCNAFSASHIVVLVLLQYVSVSACE